MRSTMIFCTILFNVFVAVPLSADCPCVPITHLWMVKTCDDWNCASTELILAAGDPQVIAVPVGLYDSRWLVLRRMATGSAIDVGNDPFELRQFDGMDGAMTHFAMLPRERKPMVFTAPDGQILVISLKQGEPRRRSAAR